jgi:predicted secreted protein
MIKDSEITSKVLVLSHCLLNKSTRWWQNNKSIERNRGLASQLIELASMLNVGVIQMPCPEFTLCGNPRPPRTKDEYEMLPGFIEHCGKMAKLVAEQIKTLITMSEKPRIEILAVIGVKRSPSCAVNSAIRRVGCGKHAEEEGIFMGFLRRELLRENLSPPFLEFDFDKPEEIKGDLIKVFNICKRIVNYKY